MRKILYSVAALTVWSSAGMADNSADTMEQRVLSELANRSGIAAGELQQVLNQCDLNQRTMNLCAFQRAIRAELLLDDAIKASSAKTDSDYIAWKQQLQSRCQNAAEKEAKGGTMLPMLISECQELAMLAERYMILGPENFPPPPQPPHKWD